MNITFNTRESLTGRTLVECQIGGATFDFGALGVNQLAELAQSLRDSADDLHSPGIQQTEAYAEGRKDECEEWVALLEAAKKVTSHIDGCLPIRGWLRDNDSSREALGELAAAIASVEGKS